jgi:hypothetical protein
MQAGKNERLLPNLSKILLFCVQYYAILISHCVFHNIYKTEDFRSTREQKMSF